MTDCFRGVTKNKWLLKMENFHAKLFEGRWTDDHKHCITVTITPEHQGAEILALIQKPTMLDKHLVITFDEIMGKWKCGNRMLDSERSDSQTLLWASSDRVSLWKRMPGECIPPKAPFYDALIAGTWMDNQGHVITAEPVVEDMYSFKAASFSVIMQRPGEHVKLFRITKDKATDEWKCGNGKLVRNCCGPGTLAWLGSVGLVTTWTRMPLNLTVPVASVHPWGPAVANDLWNGGIANQPWGAAVVNQPWGPADPNQPWAPADSNPPLDSVLPNLEFVPRDEAAWYVQLQENLHQYSSEDSSHTMCLGPGCYVEWLVKDPWDRLVQYPKGSCISSQSFDVSRSSSLYLEFYPNGCATAQDGFCSVALVSGGAKLQMPYVLSVNGTDRTPTACDGGRALACLPQPVFSEEMKNLFICVKVLGDEN